MLIKYLGKLVQALEGRPNWLVVFAIIVWALVALAPYISGLIFALH